ncbi:MAG: hypothetical protein ABSC25_00820 [Roseiarcus sp.]|jgi:hypothetical protein
MKITFQRPDDTLDSAVGERFRNNAFDKLVRGAGSMGRGDELRKRLGLVQNLAASATAAGDALRKRVAAFDRGLAEVEARLRRIEANRGAVESANQGLEKLRAAMNAARPIDLEKALAERARRNFFH